MATKTAIVKASDSVDSVVALLQTASHTLILCPRMDGGLDCWWSDDAPEASTVCMMFAPGSSEAEVLAEIARFSREA